MTEAISGHVLIMAKAPVPGLVKTRLCPPCTAHEAAAVAAAALADTLGAVVSCRAHRRVLSLDGPAGAWVPPGVEVIQQAEGGLDDRLEAAWAQVGGPGLQIGMDTPQVTGELLDESLAQLSRPGVDAVLGRAEDGGWWAVGFNRPRPGAFRGVSMSTPHTGARQLARLHAMGLNVRLLPTLRDLDTIDDAAAIAGETPASRTAAVVDQILHRHRGTS